MTTNIQPKIYPGLICSSVEIFVHENQLKAFAKGQTCDFQDLPYAYHAILSEAMEKEPTTLSILNEWYPESKVKQLEQFAKCRFGGLDYTPDIKNMELQDGEYWECPLRGACKGEGIVCRSVVYNNNILSNQHIKLLKMLATNMTNQNLYEAMAMCEGTFNKFKKELYAILGIQTKQEAACISKDLNLI